MSNEQFFKPYEIDEDTLKKMKAKMLEMLVYFRDFCNEHGLRFWLIGGGAIGAVREHGFVPWDDDVDVQMPRPDFDKFVELWDKYGDKDRYVFCNSNREVNYHHCGASLRDPSTTFICTYNKYNDICHGIALEIGSVHPTPDNKLLQYKQIFDGYMFALFNNQRLPNNRGKKIRTLTKIAYTLVPWKKVRDDIWIRADKQKAKYSWDKCHYVKELWGKTSFMNFPKEWFDSVVWVDFEGEKMPLPAGYHEYLTLIFGDYMQRPPAPERVAKHELLYVDMDHPYTDYKGIYYFPDKEKDKALSNGLRSSNG